MRLYEPNEYVLLLTQLTPEEMICIEHCQVHSDCTVDGECVLQERVADIIAQQADGPER